MVVAGRFQAPVTPSLAELNAQALAGSEDAARLLADRSPSCETVKDFVKTYVPVEDMLRVFDLYCDSFQRSRAKALLDTLELPVVPAVANTNAGWGG